MMGDVRIGRGDGRQLSGLLEEGADAFGLAVVAHGAGGDMLSSMLGGVSAGLVANGVSCLRFNFPYTEEGRRAPDRPPVLLDAWRAALQLAGQRSGGRPLVIGGKSLGGRMASMLAAEEGAGFAAKALVFFGYPLHAPGRIEQLRDAHLFDVSVPMLFIQGTSDPLARFDLVQDLVRRLGAKALLHVVQGGDHSFRVRGARRPDADIGQELGAVAAGFLREVLG
jgi:uncharacterized protein